MGDSERGERTLIHCRCFVFWNSSQMRERHLENNEVSSTGDNQQVTKTYICILSQVHTCTSKLHATTHCCAGLACTLTNTIEMSSFLSVRFIYNEYTTVSCKYRALYLARLRKVGRKFIQHVLYYIHYSNSAYTYGEHSQGDDKRVVSGPIARTDFVFKMFWSYAASSVTGALPRWRSVPGGSVMPWPQPCVAIVWNVRVCRICKDGYYSVSETVCKSTNRYTDM